MLNPVGGSPSLILQPPYKLVALWIYTHTTSQHAAGNLKTFSCTRTCTTVQKAHSPADNHINSTQCISLMIPACTHRNWSHGYEIAKSRSRTETHSTSILSSNMTIGQALSTTRYLITPIPIPFRPIPRHFLD